MKKDMANGNYKYVWRCAKCSNHFANIHRSEGIIKMEKKCPKCKSVNSLTLTEKEVYMQCRLYDPRINDYNGDAEENRFMTGSE